MSTEQTENQHSVVLRIATLNDEDGLRALAERDSARVPNGPLIVAEVGGTIRAALSTSENRAIADPFHPAAHLVRLLRESQSPQGARGAAGRVRGGIPRRAPWPA